MGCNTSKIKISPINENCPICFKTIQNRVITPCNHQFCGLCLTNWMIISRNNKYKSILYHKTPVSCPLCRESIENIKIKTYEKQRTIVLVKINT
tara:strand:- start:1357 stop:1638 length:282 start_codon:yes stop_codon:yes gene_type:complete